MYGRKTYEHIKLAMDNGADGYLAMPLENTELTHLLIRLKQILSGKGKATNAYDINEKTEILMYNMLCGKYTRKNEIDNIFKTLKINIDCENGEYELIRIYINDIDEYVSSQWSHGKEPLYTAVINIFKKSNVNFFVYTANVSESSIYVLVFKSDNSDISGHLESIRMNIMDILKLTVNFSRLKHGSVYSVLDKENRDEIVRLSELSLPDDSIDSVSYSDDEKEAITSAKNYINRSFKSEISLNDVARYVGLSSAYFSRLFKQETGENFIDYLIKIRMENAKRYLQNSIYKTYEISEMVGYTKSKYFSKLFKNYTGYTPTEYRTKMLRKRN